MDTLERRDPQQRDAALMAALPTLVARAQGAEGWKQILKDVRAGDIDSRAALAQLPATRKSELKDLQTARPPFSALNTTRRRTATCAACSSRPARFLIRRGNSRTGGVLRGRCGHWACMPGTSSRTVSPTISPPPHSWSKARQPDSAAR